MKTMKNLILTAAAILISVFVYSQDLTQNNLKSYREANGMMYQKYNSYTSNNGSKYVVGDTIRIGTPESNKRFTYLYEGDGFVIPYTNANSRFSGSKCEIKKIYILGTKKLGYSVGIILKSGVIALRVTDVESAIDTKEVKNNGLTSDEALDKLKREKDKLDLNIIDQVEYDKIKNELMKYIK